MFHSLPRKLCARMPRLSAQQLCAALGVLANLLVDSGEVVDYGAVDLAVDALQADTDTEVCKVRRVERIWISVDVVGGDAAVVELSARGSEHAHTHCGCATVHHSQARGAGALL